MPHRAKVLPTGGTWDGRGGMTDNPTPIQVGSPPADWRWPCKRSSKEGAARRGKRLGAADDFTSIVTGRIPAVAVHTFKIHDRLIFDDAEMLIVVRVEKPRGMGPATAVDLLCREADGA